MSAEGDGFVGQKLNFDVQAAGVTGEAVPGAKHTVTGNHNGDGIAAHRSADGLGGHGFLSQLPRRLPGKLSVGDAFPIGDGQQTLPDEKLEGSSLGGEGNGSGIRRLSSEIGIQPAPGFRQNSIVRRNSCRRRKSDSCEPLLIGGEGQRPQGRIVTGDVFHRSASFYVFHLQSDKLVF